MGGGGWQEADCGGSLRSDQGHWACAAEVRPGPAHFHLVAGFFLSEVWAADDWRVWLQLAAGQGVGPRGLSLGSLVPTEGSMLILAGGLAFYL